MGEETFRDTASVISSYQATEPSIIRSSSAMTAKDSHAAEAASSRRKTPVVVETTSMTELSRATHLQLPSFNSIYAITSVIVAEEEEERPMVGGHRRAQQQDTVTSGRPATCSAAQRPLRPSNTRTVSHHHSRKPHHLQHVVSVALFALLSLPVSKVEALICYETAANGKTTIKQNDSWSYCALVPATMHGSELINGSQFGLGNENDMLGSYNSMFGMNGEDYRVLTVCIYERYDFSRYLPMKPSEGAVEFTFRCICNYDLCNSETTFSAYLTAIKAESFSVPAAAAAPSRPRRPTLEADTDVAAAAGSDSTADDAEERRRR